MDEKLTELRDAWKKAQDAYHRDASRNRVTSAKYHARAADAYIYALEAHVDAQQAALALFTSRWTPEGIDLLPDGGGEV